MSSFTESALRGIKLLKSLSLGTPEIKSEFLALSEERYQVVLLGIFAINSDYVPSARLVFSYFEANYNVDIRH